MMDEDEQERILSEMPDSFATVTDQHYPLIVTYTKLLSMVDNSLPSPFLKVGDTQTKKSAWSAEGNEDRNRNNNIHLISLIKKK